MSSMLRWMISHKMDDITFYNNSQSPEGCAILQIVFFLITCFSAEELQTTFDKNRLLCNLNLINELICMSMNFKLLTGMRL